MADEITESAVGQPSAEFGNETTRDTKPGLKRLLLTLSVLFSFFIAFPFMWKSVEIYRSPLPFSDIETLSTELESDPIQFPCRFEAVFINFDGADQNTLQSSILNEMKLLSSKKSSSQCGACSANNYAVSVRVESLDYYDDVDFGDDERVDQVLLKEVVGVGRKKVYTVVVISSGDEKQPRAVVGKYRHAWILGKGLSEELVVSRVADIFLGVFVNGGRKDEATIQPGFIPVGADGKIVLSFNLLNADPSDWVYDWDFKRIDETLLAPVIEALGPVANISVESQVLYHTPKSSLSYWDDKWNSYIFTSKDLPFFVNSNEWHLDTSIAAGGRSKILQFVVYVPSAKECPLLLKLPNGEISKTNGFISPMWGGVTVWNPPICLKDSEQKNSTRHSIPPQGSVQYRPSKPTVFEPDRSTPDLEEIFEVIMGQLRQLFSLRSDNRYEGTSGTINLLPSEKGFTEWELDVLSRQHTCFNIHSCATTLGSLSRLVQSLPRMIIKDEIGKQVKFSLAAAKLALSNASHGDYEFAAVSSRQARSLAEDAFFHPSIMSVSYYSFEHCFAVYSPFFLPVSMHVILAAVKEYRRYRKEKAKYLAWKAR
ncbi:hypothetical protein ACFE04_000677 [Oxalis oulophora]